MSHDPQASVSRLKIDFAQASDPGRDPNKQVNEDSCGYAETRFGHLAVLCDGMGGHYGGREASRTAITTIFEIFEQLPLATPPAEALKTAIEAAGPRTTAPALAPPWWPCWSTTVASTWPTSATAGPTSSNPTRSTPSPAT